MKFEVGNRVIIKDDVIDLLGLDEIFGDDKITYSPFKIKEIDFNCKERCMICGHTHFEFGITIVSTINEKFEITMTECELEFSFDEKINKLLNI